MSDLYENLLKATDNTSDITTEKFGTVIRITDNVCDVKEDGADIEHGNVPILNGLNLTVGSKVVLGFVDNSIYDVFVIGSVGSKDLYTRAEIDDALLIKQDLLVSGTNIKTINNQSLLGSGNITIQGGGGGSVIGTGSFSIDSNGHLIVELPDAVDNPYYINNNGHLIYDTSNTHNGE